MRTVESIILKILLFTKKKETKLLKLRSLPRTCVTRDVFFRAFRVDEVAFVSGVFGETAKRRMYWGGVSRACSSSSPPHTTDYRKATPRTYPFSRGENKHINSAMLCGGSCVIVTTRSISALMR